MVVDFISRPCAPQISRHEGPHLIIPAARGIISNDHYCIKFIIIIISFSFIIIIIIIIIAARERLSLRLSVAHFAIDHPPLGHLLLIVIIIIM
jgi:hypothetical protein